MWGWEIYKFPQKKTFSAKIFPFWVVGLGGFKNPPKKKGQWEKKKKKGGEQFFLKKRKLDQVLAFNFGFPPYRGAKKNGGKPGFRHLGVYFMEWKEETGPFLNKNKKNLFPFGIFESFQRV